MAGAIASQAQGYYIYRPDIWAPVVDKFFQAKLVCAKFFQNFSDYVTEGGKSIIIPAQQAYTAQAVTTTSGDLNSQLVTDTGYRLDINLWYDTVRVFADFQKAQVASSYRMKEIFAEGMAYALAKQLDSSIMGLFTALYPSRVVNASTAGLKSSDLEAALAIIESYNIPREECAWFFHPKVYFGQILGVQKFYDASMFGKITPLANGTHDSLYGVPVFVTTQVPAADDSTESTTGYRCILAHKNSIGYALGNLPNTGNASATPSGVRMQELSAEALRTTYVADIMYGVKTIGGGYRGVRLISKN